MSRLPRVTNDTNVWLSALYFSGKPAQIVHLIEEQEIVSVTSSFILEELKEKWLITGDKDLLSIKKYKNTQRVTPAQFLTKYKLGT